ncbi:replication initiator [Streptosporangium canum]|uniref:replication initiator n=1 Tax=Streptosporangium canum TaxID=324952 RepID=UPI0036795078
MRPSWVALSPTTSFSGVHWGAEPVYVATELDGVSDKRVAAYIAKYATKGAESAGTVDRPIRQVWEVARLEVTEHARRMIYACFGLGDLPEYRDVPLRRWAHMLGYGGISRPSHAVTR